MNVKTRDLGEVGVKLLNGLQHMDGETLVWPLYGTWEPVGMRLREPEKPAVPVNH